MKFHGLLMINMFVETWICGFSNSTHNYSIKLIFHWHPNFWVCPTHKLHEIKCPTNKNDYTVRLFVVTGRGLETLNILFYAPTTRASRRPLQGPALGGGETLETVWYGLLGDVVLLHERLLHVQWQVTPTLPVGLVEGMWLKHTMIISTFHQISVHYTRYQLNISTFP